MSVPISSSMLPAKPPVVTTDPDERKTPPTIDLASYESKATPSYDSPASIAAVSTEDRSNQTTPGDPPLPVEAPPPLPNEELPTESEDDGWEPVWDETAQAFYFHNKMSNLTQWENPRVPQAVEVSPPRIADTGPPGAAASSQARKPPAGGYDPAIHGDYDPNADYAKVHELAYDGTSGSGMAVADPTAAYAATGTFNRFTGKWQRADINPENFNDENKSKRQMNAFFDVDATANSHDGRSLKAERSGKRITKTELKAFREKRKEKKEEKRRAWLRD